MVSDTKTLPASLLVLVTGQTVNEEALLHQLRLERLSLPLEQLDLHDLGFPDCGVCIRLNPQESPAAHFRIIRDRTSAVLSPPGFPLAKPLSFLRHYAQLKGFCRGPLERLLRGG